MQVKITVEKKGEIEDVMKMFEKHLSQKVILSKTAAAINQTMQRAIPKINKAIKAEYNITPKYLKRVAMVKPKAYANFLNAGIYLAYSRLPIVAFKPKQTKTGVSVSIKKGQSKLLRSAFMVTVVGVKKTGEVKEHQGVFSRGTYNKKDGFRSGKARLPIVERTTASVYSMGLGKKIAPQVIDFIDRSVARAVGGVLQGQVDKFTKKF